MSLTEAIIKKIVKQTIREHFVEERNQKKIDEKEKRELLKQKKEELFCERKEIVEKLQFIDVVDTSMISFDIKFGIDGFKYHTFDDLEEYLEEKFKKDLEKLNDKLAELLKPAVDFVAEINSGQNV